jgi:hypothetical protein
VASKAKSRANDKQNVLVVAEKYLDARAKDMKPLSLDQCQRHVRNYFKALHPLALRKIERATVAAELRAIAKAHGAVQADWARSTLPLLWLVHRRGHRL